MAERLPYPGDGEDPVARDGAGGRGHERGPIGAGAVFDLADAIEPRYRVLVLVLAFVPGVSRQGILSCRRRHLDLPRSRMRTDVLPDGGSEHVAAAAWGGSDRWAALPPFLVEELSRHLDGYAQPGSDGYLFTGPDGGPLDLANWHKSLRRAREAVGLTDIRPHDLHRDGGRVRRPAGGAHEQQAPLSRSAALGEGVRCGGRGRGGAGRHRAAEWPRSRAPRAVGWRRPRAVLGYRGSPGTGGGRPPVIMSPGVRKFALAAHVALAVGWIGALAGYIALDVAATTSRDPQTLRASYLAMGIIAWYVIVPLALASLLSGLLMSLGTKWGLFRSYWVLISLLLTMIATAVLLVETQTIGYHADVAADPRTSGEDLRALGSTLVHSVGGMAVLLVILVLNVYKPRGMTRYGWRKQEGQRRVSQP